MKRIAALGLGVVVTTFAILANAQAWPSKPIKWIVPFAPGGTTDILARTVGDKLAIALGVPVIVENKPGAGGGVGAEFTAKAAPDGYTIMGGTISTHAINASLYKDLPYDPVKDFVPITLIARVPNMLVVNPAVPAKDVKELIVLLKANPTKYTFASSGNGTSQHLSGELFKSMAGVEMQHIPYKGSPPALQDVVGGQVTMTFDNITTAWPLAKSGKLRALAVTTAKRSSGRAGRPDARRVGAARIRDRLLARRVRAGGHAAGDRQAPERRDREDPRHARGARETGRARRRDRRRLAGGIRGAGQGGSRQVVGGREEVGCEGRLSEAGERERAEARGRPREQGEAKERSSRLQARAAADSRMQRVQAKSAEAARRRAMEVGRWSDVAPVDRRGRGRRMSAADAILFPGFESRRIATRERRSLA